MQPTLNQEQLLALEAIQAFLLSEESFFVLKGSAGTGKTFCIRKLVDKWKSRIVFTAPTNKAVKVLRESVTTQEYKPECRTIYSLLGLRLEASGEVKELRASEDDLDLSEYKVVVVDEGSMVSSAVMGHIETAAETYKLKFVFLLDSAQLPPVGEERSPALAIPNFAELTKVMRHDNAILELATRLRDQVDRFAPMIKLTENNTGGSTGPGMKHEGIWKFPGKAFDAEITAHAGSSYFSVPYGSKVIAWRNVEVDRFNKLIRGTIFPNASQPWLVGDRVLFTSPARDLEDKPMASTDDEGVIERVDTEYHAEYGDFKVWRVSITLDDNRTVVARVLHEDSLHLYVRKLEDLIASARALSRKWKDYWAFKEAFHQIRYAYAITAHRSQGSTYDTAFVYWQDILINRNRQEAFRCLYVAITRPKRALILS